MEDKLVSDKFANPDGRPSGNLSHSWEEDPVGKSGLNDSIIRVRSASSSSIIVTGGRRRNSNTSDIDSSIHEGSTSTSLSETASASVQALIDGFTKDVSSRTKHWENIQRRGALSWQQLLLELTNNERAAWAPVAARTSKTVFWALENTVNNNKMRLKSVRNDEGTNHRIATDLTRGKSLKNNENDESRIPLTSHIRKPIASDSALWKSLKDYTNRKQQTQDGEEGIIDEEEELKAIRDEADERDATAVPANASALSIINEIAHVKADKAEIITSSTNSSYSGSIGTLELFKSKIVFTRSTESDANSFVNTTGNEDFTWAINRMGTMTWPTSDVVEVQQKPYLFQFMAIELLLTNRQTIMINLHNEDTARQFYRIFWVRIKTTNINPIPHIGRLPRSMIRRTKIPSLPYDNLTSAWVNHEITNFDYLMHLNIMAGRTFNDLGQYPIFPWVLKDYSSSKLDLRNPKSFRDLRYPIGAQTEENREVLKEKYYDLQKQFESTEDDDFRLPPFQHGSFYSCAAYVLWFLVRVEPFTSLHIWLQEGKFDKSDRLFHSIEAAWNGCINNASDVKELIPEMYCCPEMFENQNDLDLGTTQSGRQLGAVKLPPWANNAQDFVRKHRAALESEYVSRNLHHWIDLIFGVKQRPPHLGGSESAVEACNVFFHLTYSNAVDLDALSKNDPQLYQQTVRQVANFGQVNFQLPDHFPSFFFSPTTPSPSSCFLFLFGLASVSIFLILYLLPPLLFYSIPFNSIRFYSYFIPILF